LWDASDGRLIRELPLDVIKVRQAAFTPDGRRVLIADGERKVGWWGATKGETKFFPLEVVRFEFSPRGDRILLDLGDGTQRLWNVNSEQLIGPPLKAGQVQVFSPDGNRLLLGAPGGVQLWDTTTGSAIAAPLPHVDEFSPPVFSPDSRKLMTRCDDGHVRIWNAATGQALSPPLAHDPLRAGDGEHSRPFFSPQSDLVVTARNDDKDR
jgi:WD40 repeat protein